LHSVACNGEIVAQEAISPPALRRRLLFGLSGISRWLNARPDQNPSVCRNSKIGTEHKDGDPFSLQVVFSVGLQAHSNPESVVPALIAGHSDGQINVAAGARCALGPAADRRISKMQEVRSAHRGDG
jgi:hypothetical protein